MSDAGGNDAPGFRPLLTRASHVGSLLASPTQYDAAPSYVTVAFADQSEQIKREVAARTAAILAERAADDTLGNKLRIALELTAPIGFNIVRSYALLGQAAAIVAGGPISVLLGGATIFFTGRALMRDFRRAFTVDPKVRDLIDRAQQLVEKREFRRAETLLKEALGLDIDPTYRRNGDLYLHLGVVQMQDGRARQAMVSFAKASVLFGADDAIPLERDGRKVLVSKRGFTEMLACAAVDSFARDEDGLAEWSEVLSDFARSAETRLEHFAASQEAGHVFGLFGVDRDAARYGREIAAKVRFFAAKMRLRGAALGDAADVDALIDAAVADLEAADLTARERFDAIFEQASFYATVATKRDQNRGALAVRAVRLMEAGARAIDTEDPHTAARARAELAAFALDVIPHVAATGDDVRPLRGAIEQSIDRLRPALQGPARDMDLAPVARGWVEEVRYRLGASAVDRAAASRAAHRAFLDAGEPVAAMYAALRTAYATDDKEAVRAAVDQVMEAARQVLAKPPAVGLQAFAAKYLLDAAAVAGIGVDEITRSTSADWFREAARAVAVGQRTTAFYLQGRLVVHPAAVAELVYLTHAAVEYARAGRASDAVALFEEVRARVAVSDPPPEVQMAVDLDYAALLAALGERSEAQATLEQLEREARARGDTRAHHRALELLHQVRTTGAPESSVDDAPLTLPEPEGAWLGAFNAARTEIVRTGRALVEALAAEELRDILSPTQRALVQRLGGRLDRLAANRFRLGIVGEFSAGKSTFINALLGASVLPSAVRPTTAVVTRITWAEEPSLFVRFRDGRSESAAIADLARYVTEKGNAGNALGVAEVEIRYPLQLLAEGVEILDTPGVSSLISSHTETTYALLPTCDAVVLLTTGRQPYTDSVGRFLSDLRAVVHDKVFYVLNKIDQLEVDRRDDAVRFARDWLASRVAGARVFALASYHALVSRRLVAGTLALADVVDDPRLGVSRDASELLAGSGVVAFEAALGEFLRTTRAGPLLRETARELLDVYGEIERIATAERESAKMDAARRHSEWTRLTQELARVRTTIEGALNRLDLVYGSIVDHVEQRAHAEVPRLADAVVERVQLTAADGRSRDALAALSTRVGAAIEQEIAAWTCGVAVDASEDIAAAVATAQRELRAAQRELHGEFARSFSFAPAMLSLDAAAIAVDASTLEDGASVVGSIVRGGVGVALGFAFGVVGIAAAVILDRVLEPSDEEAVRKLREKLSPVVATRLEAIARDLAVRLREQVLRTADDARRAILLQRDTMLGEFEDQLSSLIRERDDADAVARARAARVETVQHRSSVARRRLRELLLALGGHT